MKNKQRKNIITSIIVMVSIGVFLLNYSCQDKQEAFQQIEPQNEIGEFFVNESTAKIVAENFMKKTNPSLKSSKNYTLQKIKDDEGEELIYVINFNEGGFILMPTDNRVNPILAFSKTNSFKTENVDQINGLSLWMNDTKKGIKGIKKSKEPQSKEMKALWEKQLKNFNLKEGGIGGDPPCEDSYESKGPLLSTAKDEWCQYVFFNTECPTEAETEAICGCDCDFTIDGHEGYAYTGCVPVAMGMIMAYHQYPNTYNWSQMPDFPGNSTVAGLLYDIGEHVNIRYECTGSPVDTWRISYGFWTFGYSHTATLISYNPSNDLSRILAELDANRPVILTGYNSEGGHAWVCDGYEITQICVGEYSLVYNYLNMNWGEGGIGNGLYGFSISGYSNLSLVYGIKP